MTFETETVLDRRRLRRRLSLWRVLAVIAAAPRRRASRCSRRPMAARGAAADRPRHHRGAHHRRPRPAAADQEGRRQPGGRRGDPDRQQPRRHHGGRRGAVRGDARARQEEAAGGAVRHGGHLGRLYRRPRHRPDRRSRQHHHRLGRRHLPVAGVLPAAGEARHQGQRDQERAAEGQPFAVPAARRARPGGGREDGGRIATLVPGSGAHPAQHRHRRACRAWSRAACSPAARRSPTS